MGTMQQGMKARIDAALRHPAPWPFEPILEAAYQAACGPTRRRRLCVTLLVCAASILAALALEAPWSGGRFLYLLAWRGGATLGLVAAAFTVRWIRTARQEAALVAWATLLAMGVVQRLGEQAGPAFAASYMFAALAVVAGILTCSQVRFSTAIVTCASCAIGFPLVMLIYPESLPLTGHWSMPGAAVIGFAVLLVAARRNDINRRTEYLHRLRHETVETELTVLNRELLRLSTTDMLTGLSNRRHFDQEAARVWNDRAHAPFVLAILDIDHFKLFNDAAGHAAGDACLATVAHALEGALRRDTDRAARYGGEEFVVLAPGMAAADAAELGERLRLAVEDLHIPHPGLPGLMVTISVGVIWKTGRAGSFDALLRDVDKLLYQAKDAGRNHVCSSVPGLRLTPLAAA